MTDKSSGDLTSYLLEVLNLEVKPDSESFNLTSWHAVDATNFECPKCGNTGIVLISTMASSSLEGSCIVCPVDKKVIWTDYLSLTTRDEVKKLFEQFKNRNDITNWPIENLIKSLKTSNVQEGSSSNSAGSDDAGFAPKGYRHIAWIRKAEAEAVLKAIENKSTVKIDYPDKSSNGEARFYPDDSNEAKRYLANVHVVRIRKSGIERWVGWIRIEEAEAVLESMRRKSDITFAHRKEGKGGLIKYFDASSESAKKYRSQTRLLRRS